MNKILTGESTISGLPKYQSPTSDMIPKKYLGRVSTQIAKRIVKFLAFGFLAFLALLNFVSRATIMAQCRRHPSSIRLSVHKLRFLGNHAWTQAKFCGQLPVHHISRPFLSFFQNFQFSIFLNIFSFLLTWDPTAAKLSKRYSSYNFHLISHLSETPL